jgi:hypothetical protein
MKRLAGLSALAVLIVGVSLPAQEAAAPTTHPYYPIKVGSEWTYKVQGGPIKMKITGTEKVGQATGYKIEVTAGNKVSATEVVGVTKDGVFRYNVNSVAAEPPSSCRPTRTPRRPRRSGRSTARRPGRAASRSRARSRRARKR